MADTPSAAFLWRAARTDGRHGQRDGSTETRASARHRFDFEVVGVGALNLDLIANWAAIAPPDRAAIQELFPVDRQVTTQDLDELVGVVALIARSAPPPRAEPGGSAFNTIRALGAMRLGLRLGYVAVAAESPPELVEVFGAGGLPPARESLTAAGIDQGGVLGAPPPGGLSVSLVNGQTRSIRTFYDGRFADTAARHLPELIEYLRRAKHVHVTSIYGLGAASVVADLIESTLADGREHTVSVDPGETWAGLAGSSTEDGSAIDRILACADVILLNETELTHLAGSAEPRAAREVLDRYGRGTGRAKLVLLKRVAEAQSFAIHHDRFVADRWPQRVLPSSRIVDATGAGDVFAAGVLAALVSDWGSVAGGMALGNAASRHKIQFLGSAGYQNLHEVDLVEDLRDSAWVGNVSTFPKYWP